MGNTRDLLDIKLFSQRFNEDLKSDLQSEDLKCDLQLEDCKSNLQLLDCKSIAKLYSTLENTISVLSDMVSRKSYIYAGATAQHIGFEPTGQEINSIWEDDLLSKIHPEDLQKKYLLELQFFQLIKTVELEERTNYCLITKLSVKNKEGKYVTMKHRLLYLSSTAGGNVWLVLCLYSMVYDHPGFDVPDGLILNTKTGAIIDNKEERPFELLTNREREIIQLIYLGIKSKEIAARLSLSIHTVNRHRQNIFQKLGVDNAIEAIKVANSIGVLRNLG